MRLNSLIRFFLSPKAGSFSSITLWSFLLLLIYLILFKLELFHELSLGQRLVSLPEETSTESVLELLLLRRLPRSAVHLVEVVCVAVGSEDVAGCSRGVHLRGSSDVELAVSQVRVRGLFRKTAVLPLSCFQLAQNGIERRLERVPRLFLAEPVDLRLLVVVLRC